MPDQSQLLSEMSERSREVFQRVVEGYLSSGEPIGSRTLAKSLSERISAATVRNVMQDLESLGLLDSPHVSAGRIPTERGLRLFVDGFMEIGTVSQMDREQIDATLDQGGSDVGAMLGHMSGALSAVTRSASIVLTPKHESAPIKHIEFVSLSPDRTLVVLVFADGQVENRLFRPPPGQTPSSMREAANFINSMVGTHTLEELSRILHDDIILRRQEIDSLARELVESGIAVWEDAGLTSERLIVRGASNLLEGVSHGMPGAGDVERIRGLFDDLERQRDIAEFLELADEGAGVRIFIGSENKLFSLSGSTLVVSPYMNAERKIIGAVGVIGPTRLNYGRVVPIVDYTAQLVGRMLAERRHV